MPRLGTAGSREVLRALRALATQSSYRPDTQRNCAVRPGQVRGQGWSGARYGGHRRSQIVRVLVKRTNTNRNRRSNPLALHMLLPNMKAPFPPGVTENPSTLPTTPGPPTSPETPLIGTRGVTVPIAASNNLRHIEKKSEIKLAARMLMPLLQRAPSSVITVITV